MSFIMMFFMTKTIAKTFRIDPQLAQEIEKEARQRHLTQGGYLGYIFFENKKLKMQKEFEKNLCVMEHHVEYQKEQKDLADSDFL